MCQSKSKGSWDTTHFKDYSCTEYFFLCMTELVTQPNNFSFQKKKEKEKNKKSIKSLIYFPIAKVKTLN